MARLDAYLTEDLVRSRLREEVSRLAESQVAPEDIPDDVALWDNDAEEADSIGLDSLDALELGIMLESELGVLAPEEADFKSLRTINDLVAFALEQASGPDGQGRSRQ